MSETETETKPKKNSHSINDWSEARLIVFIIGISLIIEGVFIHLQAGLSHIVISSATGLAGVILMLLAWFAAFDDEAESETEDKTEEITQTQTLPRAKEAKTADGGKAEQLLTQQPKAKTEPQTQDKEVKEPKPTKQAAEQAKETEKPLETEKKPPETAKAEVKTEAEAEAPELKAEAEKPEPKAEAETPELKAEAETPELKAETEKPEPKAEAEAPELKAEAEKAAEPAEPSEPAEPELSWFQRLSSGLEKTRSSFIGRLKKLVFGTAKIDEDLLDELEEVLFEADVGVKTTQELLDYLNKRVAEDEIKEPKKIYELLREQLKNRLTKRSSAVNINEGGLSVFLVIGVNGVGKTTTIAKLAYHFVNGGKKVLLAAGDTFRAAAIDQLCIWGQKAGVEVIKGSEGGDPGALVFDAIHAAKKRGTDILIIDTAGRMHVKANLMAELIKIKKIAEKESGGGPHEVLLVLDAATGQNAVLQARQFKEALPITGLVVTKLDGTAKGGVLFAVEEQIDAPVKFIGVGEKMQDLMPFEADKFLEALFADDSNKQKTSDYKVL